MRLSSMAEAYLDALFWSTTACPPNETEPVALDSAYTPSVPLMIIAEIECQVFLNQLHYKVLNVVEGDLRQAGHDFAGLDLEIITTDSGDNE